MSKQLILIRHSYAENGSFNTMDFDRELSTKGKNYMPLKAKELANYMSDKILFVSSDAKRAVQTSEIVMQVLNYDREISFEHFLYEDYTTQDFMNFIHNQNDSFDKLLVIGHNPTLANIAYRLCPDFNHSVPPGTIIVLDFNVSKWNEIEVNSASLIDIIN